MAERTHAWTNSFGKLRRSTQQRTTVVDSDLFLTAGFFVTRSLIKRAGAP